jgi:hypothetical protein
VQKNCDSGVESVPGIEISSGHTAKRVLQPSIRPKAADTLAGTGEFCKRLLKY